MKQNKITLLICSTILLGGTTFNVVAQDDRLDLVLVTSKTNQKAINIAQSTEVISREDIENSGANSVAEVLKTVAGFNWTQNSSSISGRRNIGLRGLDSSHVLVLVDGKRLTDTDDFIGHSNFKVSFVDLNSVERIEIIKGAGSVLYGSDAMGGIINIITKTGSNANYGRLKLHGSMADGRDGGDGKGISVVSVFGDDDTRVNVNINKDHKDVVSEKVADINARSPGNQPGYITKFEGQTNQNLFASLSHKFNSSNQVGLSLGLGKEKRDKVTGNDELTRYYDIDRTKYSAFYRVDFGDLSAKFQGYHNETSAAYHGFGQSPYYTHNIEDKILSADLFGNITSNQYITVGVEQRKVNYFKDYSDPTRADYKSKENTQNSIYGQNTVSFDSGVLTLGLRLDDNSQYGNGTSPAIGYVHNFSDLFNFKINLAQAFKAPNIKEGDSNYSAGHGPTTKFKGNSDLKPETSKSMEIGVSGSASAFDYSVAIYQNKISDMIASKLTSGSGTPADPKIYTYSNVNNATINGLEVSINMDLTQTMYLDLDYSHMQTDDGDGKELNNRPNHTFKMKLNNDFSNGLNVGILAVYTGESKDGTDTLDSYTTVDFVLNKLLTKNLKAQFSINNLTDETLESNSENSFGELIGREFKLSFSLKI